MSPGLRVNNCSNEGISANSKVIVIHRYEASTPRTDVLKEVDAYTVGLDRPA